MQDVRLIACDLDGTLLDEAKQLLAELLELVKRLQTRGEVFCPASGRQYHTIREQFAPICSGIPVIAETVRMSYWMEKSSIRSVSMLRRYAPSWQPRVRFSGKMPISASCYAASVPPTSCAMMRLSSNRWHLTT